MKIGSLIVMDSLRAAGARQTSGFQANNAGSNGEWRQKTERNRIKSCDFNGDGIRSCSRGGEAGDSVEDGVEQVEAEAHLSSPA